ncbi:hypothetical protein [Micromonospora globispora]|uniref:hypothetical protein n=1 Tax=Micromonospora globispora TaxID=1450148 RepID=UPI001FAE7C32|nr:hypothetical protein [Micromonospora globispora]
MLLADPAGRRQPAGGDQQRRGDERGHQYSGELRAAELVLGVVGDAGQHPVAGGRHGQVRPSMVASPIHDSTADAGVSLQGVSRLEPVEGVVAAILRAATARRAPREDVATTRRGRVELALARHAPALADRLVRRTVAGRIAAGDLDAAPLAAGMVRRHRDAGR